MTWNPSTADLIIAGSGNAPADCTAFQAIVAAVAEALHGYAVGHSGKRLGRIGVALADAPSDIDVASMQLHVVLPGQAATACVRITLEAMHRTDTPG